MNSGCIKKAKSGLQNLGEPIGGAGLFKSLINSVPGGAGHERGSTHSVQSLLNLDNTNAQWDILTEY